MSDELEDTQGLSIEEIEQQGNETAEQREQSSLASANLAAPVNAAVAASILSDDPVANANPEQNADREQAN